MLLDGSRHFLHRLEARSNSRSRALHLSFEKSHRIHGFFSTRSAPLPPVPQALVRIHPGSGRKTLYLGAHAPTSSGGRHIAEGPPAMERATVVPHQQVTGSPVVLIDEPWLGSEGGQFGEQRAALLWRVPAATCAAPQVARRRPRCRIITRVPWPILRDTAYSRDCSGGSGAARAEYACPRICCRWSDGHSAASEAALQRRHIFSRRRFLRACLSARLLRRRSRLSAAVAASALSGAPTSIVAAAPPRIATRNLRLV